ncbi:MAG: DUF4349 domain-containing protein [Acidobacteriota bacterium]
MRKSILLVSAVSLMFLSGCEQKKVAEQAQPQAAAVGDSTAQGRIALDSQGALSGALVTTVGGRPQQGSLNPVSMDQPAPAGTDRKIIRNGELIVETDSPTDGQRAITAIAESHGGFVVTSEFKRNDAKGQSTPNQTVTVIVRVPSAQFLATIEQIRGVGSRIIQEKITGQDVSEEYLDLEARIRTKKALEAQFLEIMKQARKVSDALEVQSQLADVRTEIEQFEGRRRFLENQSALSTITATLQMPAPLVAATTTGFSHSVKQASGDAVDTAVAILLFFVQAVIVLAPVAVLIGLPAWFVWRLLRRRFELTRKDAPVAEAQ